MFSITPNTRMFDLRAKSAARAATRCAASAGVVTTIWPIWEGAGQGHRDVAGAGRSVDE